MTLLNPSTLLLGANADTSSGAIYEVPITHSATGHITGLGPSTLYASAPDIDGTLIFGPGGVLFATAEPSNTLMEYKPGRTSPDLTVSLGPLGVSGSVGAVEFVPAGLPGAGGFKITSNTGDEWYSATLSQNSSGTYDVSDVTAQFALPNCDGCPEQSVYVTTASPQFSVPSIVMNGCSGYAICVYSTDASGDPTGNLALFASNLPSPGEGAFIDPITGDLLISTDAYGPTPVNEIIEFRGFAPGSMTASAGSQTALVDSAFAMPLTVTVSDPFGQPVSGLTVDFAAPSSGAGATLSAGSVVTNASGQASVTATANSTSGTYTVTATAHAFSAGFSLTNTALSALTLSPASVVGGNSDANNTITLTSPAPPSGATIALSSSNAAVAAPPTSVTVAGGQTVSAPFSITTTAVSATGHVTIKASDGVNKKSANLTVKPPALTSVKLSPRSTTGGKSTTGNTVVLNGPAPVGGVVVDLSSSDSSVATPPTSVTIPAGSTTSPAFTITTTAVVSDTPVTISASYGDATKTADLTVNAPALSSLKLSPATVTGGHSTTKNKVTLNGVAPAGGAMVMLTSGDSSIASPPTTVTVPEGSTSMDFTITTTAVSSSTVVAITASFGGVAKSANLTVNP